MGSGSAGGSGFSVDLNALEDCQSTVSKYAGKFETASTNVSAHSASGNSFGELGESQQLVHLTAQLNSAARSQFGDAHKFLSAVANGLGQAKQSYSNTESVNTSNAKGAGH